MPPDPIDLTWLESRIAKGDYSAVLAWSERILAEPGPSRAYILLARALWHTGAVSSAHEVLCRLGETWDPIYVSLRQQLAYLSTVRPQPQVEALQAAKSGRFRRDRHIFIDAVTEAIDHRPLSYIRLGDGEGTVLAATRPPSKTTVAPAGEFLRQIMSVWFGATADASPRGREAFAERVGSALREAIRAADFLGLPEEPRVENEYVRSARGFWGLSEIIRQAGELREANFSGTFVPNGFSSLLLEPDVLAKWLAGRRFLGVITCYPELPDKLAHLGIENIRLHRVPGQANRGLLGPDAVVRPHYPVVFDELLDTLSPPHVGAPFLVAAGGLGKVYCGVIRARGGVALDIGSVADVLVGNRNTHAVWQKYFKQKDDRPKG